MSTRFLILYWFKRDEDAVGEPRLGIAVPRRVGNAVVRNRMKRQLKEAWRADLGSIPPGQDYVLVAREGLPEAAETRGGEWLRERIDEVLSKAAA